MAESTSAQPSHDRQIPPEGIVSAEITQVSGDYWQRELCPADLTMLMRRMLRDLPSYINRANHAGKEPTAQGTVSSYAIVASEADDRPLPIAAAEYPNPSLGSRQVFFTVLERQYRGQQVTLVQTHHWLFLARDHAAWQLALLFSQTGTDPAHRQLLAPPQDTLTSTTAQAIRTWLRDCEAGAVRPP